MFDLKSALIFSSNEICVFAYLLIHYERINVSSVLKPVFENGKIAKKFAISVTRRK